MTLSFEPSDRFRDAAAEWGESRLMDAEAALEEKAEQALLEIEHLVSGATSVEIRVEDGTINHEPSAELGAFLDTQAAAVGLDASSVLKRHVDLYARAYLDDDAVRPPNAPPK